MAGQKECAGYWTSVYCVIIVVAWRNGVGLCWRATQQGIARSGREECARLAPAATSVAGAAYLGRLAHILFALNALKTPRSAWIHPQILRRSHSCFFSSDSFDTPPGWGWAARASTPPAFQARLQRCTLERLTSSKRVTVRRDFRAWKYSAARRRRASSSAALPLVLIQHDTVLAQGGVHSGCKDQ